MAITNLAKVKQLNGQTNDKMITVRLTQSQRLWLRSQAAESEMSLNQYCLNMLLKDYHAPQVIYEERMNAKTYQPSNQYSVIPSNEETCKT